MSVSAHNLFNRAYHKVPRCLTVHLKVTAASDVNASGYTINYGSDLVSSVAKNGEGIIDITTSFPWKELVCCQVQNSNAAYLYEYVSDVSSTGIVKLNVEALADGTTQNDPDSDVFFVTLVFNLSNVGTK